tara:strand:- start:17827 stop:18267 length:441 start_codon:yes stop_codon:yes gene_type:complete
MAKVFSIEDGNIGNANLISARKITYADIDLSFANKPSGDIFKKEHAAAVKQSVRNLLMTNFSEKPFLPRYGGNLNSFLFSLNTEVDELALEEKIIETVEIFEPRASVKNVEVISNDNRNEVAVNVTFQVLSTNEVITTEISLTRLR